MARFGTRNRDCKPKPKVCNQPKPIPSIEDIELMLMNSDIMNYRQDLCVFRVSDWSGIVRHECDCLIASKAGYLTEIEIKRSYADFLADFRKNHAHDDEMIKSFYFCVHESFADKVVNKLIEKKKLPDGIIVYNSNCMIVDFNIKRLRDELLCNTDTIRYSCINPKKIDDAQRLQLARLGTMRYRTLTSKLIKERKKIKEYSDGVEIIEEEHPNRA